MRARKPCPVARSGRPTSAPATAAAPQARPFAPWTAGAPAGSWHGLLQRKNILGSDASRATLPPALQRDHAAVHPLAQEVGRQARRTGQKVLRGEVRRVEVECHGYNLRAYFLSVKE